MLRKIPQQFQYSVSYTAYRVVKREKTFQRNSYVINDW